MVTIIKCYLVPKNEVKIGAVYGYFVKECACQSDSTNQESCSGMASPTCGTD